MNKTTSLALSKALKKAGAKQESERSWEPIKYPYLSEPEKIHWEDRSFHTEEGYSNFDCHELLERLPGEAYVCKLIENGGYVAGDGHGTLFTADTPAEALGKLYHWGLQEGHCEGGCKHKWVDGSNKHASGVEVCLKCHAIRGTT